MVEADKILVSGPSSQIMKQLISFGSEIVIKAKGEADEFYRKQYHGSLFGGYVDMEKCC